MVKDIEAARVSLEHFDVILAKRGLCPPMYIAGGFLAQFMLDLVLLEDSIGSKSEISISKHGRNVFKNGKRSLMLSRRYPIHRTETCRLIGRYYWLIGKQKKALRWIPNLQKRGSGSMLGLSLHGHTYVTRSPRGRSLSRDFSVARYRDFR